MSAPTNKAPFIRDTAQRLRARAPTEYGMSPAVAEILQGRGIDPRAHANRLRSLHASVALSRDPEPGEQVAAIRERFGNADAFAELALMPNDVVVRELIQQAALDSFDGENIVEAYCPTQQVDAREGEYKLRDRQTENQEVDDEIGPRSDSKGIPQEITAGTYKVKTRALHDTVDRKVALVAPSIESRMIAAMRVRKSLMRQHEIRCAVAAMTSTNYAAACRITVASGEQWNGGASADPIDDLQDAIAAMTAPPTHAVMGLETWQAAQSNDDLRAILGTQPGNKGLLTPMDFALYFALESVLVSRRTYTPTGSATESRVYGTASVSLQHVSRDPEARTFMRNFMLRQGAGGLVSTSWSVPGKGGVALDYEQLMMEQVHKVIDDTYGALIINARQ